MATNLVQTKRVILAFMNNQRTTSSLKNGLNVTDKATHCAGRVSANTRPQLRWADQEMGTAISCIECSYMAGLIQKVVENLRKHRLFVQLLVFVQLSFVRVGRIMLA